MPWLIGLDEAGYGPNLGPFVMTAVACHLPTARPDTDLWHVLARAVRRKAGPADGRIVIDDSKRVYSPRLGLAGLERHTRAAVPALAAAGHLGAVLEHLCPADLALLRREPWYTGTTPLPLGSDGPSAAALAEAAVACGLRWGLVRSRVVCAAAFNDLLDQADSKAAVLSHCLADLVAAIHAGHADAEPAWFAIDKHGGRNQYAAVVQHALPDGNVAVVRESAEESSYQVHGLGREVRLTFRPRADTAHLCVALASMVSKYVRELLMGEWNAFWAGHLPGLRPTAGYPGDAGRFFEAIRPIAARLGLAERLLWRAR